MHVATTRSKTCRRTSLSRKRPSRFTENVEWCGTLVVEIELAEPAVSKVQRHFLTQPALATNAIAVTDQEHPDHQLGMNRGSGRCRCKTALAGRANRPERPSRRHQCAATGAPAGSSHRG